MVRAKPNQRSTVCMFFRQAEHAPDQWPCFRLVPPRTEIDWGAELRAEWRCWRYVQKPAFRPRSRSIATRAKTLLGTAMPLIGELAPLGLVRGVARELFHFRAIGGISPKFSGDVHRITRNVFRPDTNLKYGRRFRLSVDGAKAVPPRLGRGWVTYGTALPDHETTAKEGHYLQAYTRQNGGQRTT
jgi:hypothetical protein